MARAQVHTVVILTTSGLAAPMQPAKVCRCLMLISKALRRIGQSLLGVRHGIHQGAVIPRASLHLWAGDVKVPLVFLRLAWLAGIRSLGVRIRFILRDQSPGTTALYNTLHFDQGLLVGDELFY